MNSCTYHIVTHNNDPTIREMMTDSLLFFFWIPSISRVNEGTLAVKGRKRKKGEEEEEKRREGGQEKDWRGGNEKWMRGRNRNRGEGEKVEEKEGKDERSRIGEITNNGKTEFKHNFQINKSSKELKTKNLHRRKNKESIGKKSRMICYYLWGRTVLC